MMPKIKPLLVCSVILLSHLLVACEPESPAVLPSVSPPPVMATATPLPIPTKDVQIFITDAQINGIAGARIEISAPSVPTQQATTDSQGLAHFPALRSDTEYTIRVEAEGYLSTSRTVKLLALPTIQNSDILLLGIKLEARSSALSGQVVDAQGQPLADVVVFDGKQSVLTDAKGRFELAYAEPAQLRLSFARQGYQTQVRTPVIQPHQQLDLGQIQLPARSGPLRVSLDTSHAPLGQQEEDILSALRGLKAELTGQGISFQTMNSLENLTETDILVLASPSRSFSVEEIGTIQAFVLNGGKLIVLGEWAGFGGFDVSATNQMLKPFGVHFSEDTLREQGSGTLRITRFMPHALTRNLNQVVLYQAGSVQNESAPQAQILARSSDQSFSILSNTGAYGVLLASLYGAGKVILVGDTSFLTNEDSDRNGTANLYEADNLKLGFNLFQW